jgi:hypothetical protein
MSVAIVATTDLLLHLWAKPPTWPRVKVSLVVNTVADRKVGRFVTTVMGEASHLVSHEFVVDIVGCKLVMIVEGRKAGRFVATVAGDCGFTCPPRFMSVVVV